jgi:hypothetical protein
MALDSARVTADALTPLGRNEEAAVLREGYGLQHSAERQLRIRGRATPMKWQIHLISAALPPCYPQ